MSLLRINVRLVSRKLALVLVLGTTAFCCSNAQGRDWKTGAEFQRQLNQGTQISWNSSSLKSSLNDLAQTQGVAILLDRRVDPDQEIEFASSQASLEDVLVELTDHLGLGLYVLDGLVYIGPPEEVERMMTIHHMAREQLRDADASAKRTWFAETALSWPRLAEPKGIVQQMFSDAQLPIEGLDAIPHDLWNAQELPDLSLIDRATILLAQFDLCFDSSDPTRAKIIEMPASPKYSANYRISRNQKVDLSELKTRFPDAQFKGSATRLDVTGSAIAHLAVEEMLRGSSVGSRSSRKGQEEEQLYTIRNTTTSAGSVVATVAKQLGLETSVTPEVNQMLQKRIVVEVDNVTLEELFAQTIGQLGLTHEIRGERLIIRTK